MLPCKTGPTKLLNSPAKIQHIQVRLGTNSWNLTVRELISEVSWKNHLDANSSHTPITNRRDIGLQIFSGKLTTNALAVDPTQLKLTYSSLPHKSNRRKTTKDGVTWAVSRLGRQQVRPPSTFPGTAEVSGRREMLHGGKQNNKMYRRGHYAPPFSQPLQPICGSNCSGYV